MSKHVSPIRISTSSATAPIAPTGPGQMCNYLDAELLGGVLRSTLAASVRANVNITGGGEEHVFGVTPNYEHLNWTGLDFSRAQFDQVTRIDVAEWKAEMALHSELFTQLSYHLPEALKATKAKIEARLDA